MKKTDHCIQAKVAPSEEKLGLNSSHEMPVQLKKKETKKNKKSKTALTLLTHE